MKKKTARASALEILIQFEQKQAYSNLLLNHYLKQHTLSELDRRLTTELVYGIIQRLHTLDWVADQLVKKGIHSLEPWVRQVIRIGLYQLMYLDRIPDRAAVYETVQLAKERGHPGIVRLVNGVLRAYLRKKEQLRFPNRSIQYSYPSWMVKRMMETFGEKEAIQMMEASLQPPKISLRVNRLKTTPNQMIRHFEGGAFLSALSKDGIIIEKSGNPADSTWYSNGFYTVQDESSMFVTEVVNPQPGMRILDACAAPGGKTTHLAERMRNQGKILACDVYDHKVKLIEAHAHRLGITIIQTQTLDIRQFQPKQCFDIVLLDAPCSGLGVIRRKPEIKWRKNKQEIESLIVLQRQLLDSCAWLVKPGGVLVYSTCTWEPKENQEQIEQFFTRHPDFIPDPQLLKLLPDAVKRRAIIGRGFVQILPHHFQSDGFFIARLIKQS